MEGSLPAREGATYAGALRTGEVEPSRPMMTLAEKLERIGHAPGGRGVHAAALLVTTASPG